MAATTVHRQRGFAARRQRGFGYLGALILVFMLGVALAATGEAWSLGSKRAREDELLFVGGEFRRAIARFEEQTPAQAPRYPAELAELLDDPRYPVMRRHLRRLYRDPITGSAEWGIVRGPDGRIRGVHSLSRDEPIKKGNFRWRDRAFEDKIEYAQWVFGHGLPLPTARPGEPAQASGDPTQAPADAPPPPAAARSDPPGIGSDPSPIGSGTFTPPGMRRPRDWSRR